MFTSNNLVCRGCSGVVCTDERGATLLQFDEDGSGQLDVKEVLLATLSLLHSLRPP